MKLRDTFRVDADGGHLWVVCSHPTLPDGSIAIINMTSWTNGCDEGCVIQPGEHPWVKHKTVMAFARAELLVPAQQSMLKARMGFKAFPPVSAELLERIQKAAILSIYTARKIQQAIRASRAQQQAQSAQQSAAALPVPGSPGPVRPKP